MQPRVALLERYKSSKYLLTLISNQALKESTTRKMYSHNRLQLYQTRWLGINLLLNLTFKLHVPGDKGYVICTDYPMSDNLAFQLNYFKTHITNPLSTGQTEGIPMNKILHTPIVSHPQQPKQNSNQPTATTAYLEAIEAVTVTHIL